MCVGHEEYDIRHVRESSCECETQFSLFPFFMAIFLFLAFGFFDFPFLAFISIFPSLNFFSSP
jgi:hypothetical protein